MSKKRSQALYLAGLLTGAGLLYLLEVFLGSKLGIWWGLIGGGLVFEFLFILGSRFFSVEGQTSLIHGFWGLATVAAKLGWEIFYIVIGIKYLSSPWGLGLGGLLALGWFYYCLKSIKGNR